MYWGTSPYTDCISIILNDSQELSITGMPKARTTDVPGGNEITHHVCTEGGYRIPTFADTDEVRQAVFDNIPTIKCRPEDILLCSYPKTGTSWTFEMLIMLLNKKAEFTAQTKGPTILEASPAHVVESVPSRRLLNTHVKVKYLPKEARDKNVKCILLARNPKDVAVSFYNHTVSYKALYGYEGKFENYLQMYMRGDAMRTIEDFLKNRGVSQSVIDKLADEKIDYDAVIAMTDQDMAAYLPAYGDRVALMSFARCVKREQQSTTSSVDYGSYPEYLLEWQEYIQSHPDWPVHVIYYEDLKKDCLGELGKLCQYLDLDVDPQLLADIVAATTFNKMKVDKEKKLDEETKAFFYRLTSKGIGAMCRKGEIGDWKNWFTVAQKEAFDEWWSSQSQDLTMFKFRYT